MLKREAGGSVSRNNGEMRMTTETTKTADLRNESDHSTKIMTSTSATEIVAIIEALSPDIPRDLLRALVYRLESGIRAESLLNQIAKRTAAYR